MITCGLSLGGSPVRLVCVTAGEAEPESRIQHLGSRIKHPASRIQGPGSRIQDPASSIQDPRSSIQDAAFRIQNPASRIQDSTSSIHVLGRPGTPASGEAAWGTRLFEAVCTESLLVCWAGWGAGMCHRQWQSCHCCGRLSLLWEAMECVCTESFSPHQWGRVWSKENGTTLDSSDAHITLQQKVMSWLWWL